MRGEQSVSMYSATSMSGNKTRLTMACRAQAETLPLGGVTGARRQRGEPPPR